MKRALPPPDDLFDERPVVRWRPGRWLVALVGRGFDGRRYRVRRLSHSGGWWEERPGSGVGCGGSGPYRTLREARERAEARERSALARR